MCHFLDRFLLPSESPNDHGRAGKVGIRTLDISVALTGIYARRHHPVIPGTT